MATGPGEQACAELDEVLRRFHQLRRIVARQREASLASPDGDANQRLGLVERGTRRAEARRTLSGLFDAIEAQLERQAVLELCATFERLVRSRLPTALGEARRILGQAGRAPAVRVGLDKLLRDAEALGTLQDIFDLLVAGGSDRAGRLADLRRSRNAVAHGMSPGSSPAVTVEATHGLLRELAVEFL